MHNKVVLITGASSGIGKACANLFASMGAKLALIDIQQDLGEHVTQQINQNGGNAHYWQGDVAHYETQARIHSEIVYYYGRLDVAINNAGIGGAWSKLADYPHEEFDKVMDINLKGVFYGMQLQIKQMLLQGGGSIVNVASVAGLKGLNNSSAYCASKHAVIGITKTAAVEYARDKIRINAVCPVFTRTPLVEKMFAIDARLEAKLEKVTPMQRYATPDEIANAIAWLASDQASFVTGQAMPIDGGMLA